ncbi:MAG: exodeoxyribonuclease III [Bacteroidales bacterium]|nr:exodeoxyribonuclease III [Bacteroidales bacterium]
MVKIATYNVNGINGRLPVFLRWLNETKPDIVCLQELKTPQENFPVLPIQMEGYQALWHGQKSWNGVAILARNGQPTEICRELPGDPDDVNSRYIAAMVNDIFVGCLYLPNGNPAPGPKFDYKMKWINRFIDYASELVNENIPVVLTGDFNIIPEEKDAYKPEKWVKDALFLPEVRSAFKTLLLQGWTDAIRKIYPEDIVYTFWDYFRNSYERNAGIRIDHFLLNSKMAPKLVAAGVDRNVRGWEKSSDHAPVWIEIAE